MWQSLTLFPQPIQGALLTEFDIAVGFTGSTLPGCTFNIFVSNFGGTQTYASLYSATITVPQTVNAVADPRLVINISPPLFVPPCYLKFQITTPIAGQVLNSRASTTTPFNVGNSVAPPPQELDFILWGQGYQSTQYLTLGEQGNNIGQLKLGASGTPLTQLKTYSFGPTTIPSVNANSEVLISALVATGAATTDDMFITNTGPLPSGLLITNAYCNATNQVSFKIVNFTAVNYISGVSTYSVTILGVSH
jgi:hypothetical protein